MNQFSELLKEAVQQCSPQDVEQFFEEHFLRPLNTALETDEKTPAETIRAKRQQTQKIKNFLLTLGKK